VVTTGVFLLLLAYLFGSVPTAVWVSRYFYGFDIRDSGSGNAGATNTFRVLGKKAGIPVLLVDALKGWAAAMLPVWVFVDPSSPVLFENFRVLCGAAAVTGHIFPVFAGFRGGKGVATLLGVSIGMHPVAAFCCIGLFLLVLLLTHYVSLGSILSSLFYALFILVIQQATHDATIIFAISIPLLVILTHTKNIKRLLAGNESRTYLLRNQPSRRR
jgi:acyl phosphate:glycerol-3-phosphate acyltransferase